MAWILILLQLLSLDAYKLLCKTVFIEFYVKLIYLNTEIISFFFFVFHYKMNWK